MNNREIIQEKGTQSAWFSVKMNFKFKRSIFLSYREKAHVILLYIIVGGGGGVRSLSYNNYNN